MKKAGKTMSWILRIAILAALAYFLRPWYAPPKGTIPPAQSANDYVSWILHSDTNFAVVQSLTIYGDGRHAVVIKRAIGDPDLPELNTRWKISRDKSTGLSQFRNESVLSSDQARQMLDRALQAGALDVQDEPAPTTETLEIETSFGGSQHSAKGPQFIGSAFDLNPNRWINRQRWQKLANIPAENPALKDLLAKKQVILVDDDGKEVKQ